MWKIMTLMILFVLASGCQGKWLLVDTHPELNRHFEPGIDTPGEYPY